MNKTLGLAVTSIAVALAGNVAQAGADTGSWYVSPQLQGIWLDDSRVADDNAGFAFSVGKAVAEKWNVELSLGSSNHNAANGRKLNLQSWDIGAQRVFYRESRVTPFLTLGLGRLNSSRGGASSDGAFYLKYGAGVLADISKNPDTGTNLQLRAEITGRRPEDPARGVGSPTDYIAGLGLQYNWGGTIVPKAPPDSDGDGVPDAMDKCPGTPAGTAVDANGCELDSDGDGVPNSRDKCPNTPTGAKVNADGCELDGDGDGVVDSQDKCPDTPAGAKVNAEGCELDSDGDGVVDSKDQCPDTPKGERVDSVGCPFKTEIKLPGVVFDTNSADLKVESNPVLDGAVETLKRYPDLKIEVAGHTDSRSSDAYNLALSKRRAEAVMAYLKDKGAANELSARGYGEGQPIASNSNEEGRAQNRRVVLRVLNAD